MRSKENFPDFDPEKFDPFNNNKKRGDVMKKLLFLLLAAAVSIGGISAGETAGKQMIWAHITPWFQASDHSLYTDWFFNYPLQRAKNDPKSRDITMREDILIAMDKGIDGFFIDIGAEVRAKKPRSNRSGAVFI